VARFCPVHVLSLYEADEVGYLSFTHDLPGRVDKGKTKGEGESKGAIKTNVRIQWVYQRKQQSWDIECSKQNSIVSINESTLQIIDYRD
jgi:hypothetical protein